MIVTVTATATQGVDAVPGSRYSTLIVQNENTDADVYIGFGAAPTVSGATDAGVMIPRASGANAPTTLVLGSDFPVGAFSRNLFFIHNGSGSKSLRVNLL